MVASIDQAVSTRARVLYVNPQSAKGTRATDYAAGDALGVDTFEINPGKRNSLGARRGVGFADAGVLIAERQQPEVSFAGEVPVSGSAASVSDLSDLLKSGSFLSNNGSNTTTVDSAASGTSVTVQAGQGSNYSPGLSMVEINGEIALVTGVSTDTLTLAPTLSSTPSGSDAVSAVESYYPGLDAHNSNPGVTLHGIMGGGRAWQIARDFFISELEFMAEREGPLKFSVSGKASDASTNAYSKVNGTINDSATSLVIDEPNIAVGSRIFPEGGSEQGATVTAVSADGLTLTIVRAGDAEQMTDGDRIFAYVPGQTVQDDRIPSIRGTAFVNGVEIPDVGVSFKVNFDAKSSAQRGSTDAFGPVAPGAVQVDVTITANIDNVTHNAVHNAAMSGFVVVAIRFGNETGKGMLVYLPQAAALEFPALAGDGDDIAEVEMTFRGTGNQDGEWPCVFGIT